MPPAVELPGHILRDDTFYRTLAPARVSGVRSCGFMRKPDENHAYTNRVSREFVTVYVLRGSGRFEDWHGQSHPVRAGDWIQLPAGRPHGVVQNGDGLWAEAYFTIDAGFAEALERVGLIDPDRPVLHPGLDMGLIERFEEILSILKTAPDADLPRALLRVHELMVMVQAMDRQSREPHPHAHLVERACDLLGRHLDRRISAVDLARDLGLSYERFRKVFRERTGLSPGEYRIRRRIDQARALLAHRRLSVKEVAYQLGYKDPFTFSKQFKQVVGLPPDHFRRTA